MSREDPTLRVRIPDELRAKLKLLAEAKRRTMTQEIVERLQKSVDDETSSPEHLADRIAVLEQRMAKIELFLEPLEAQDILPLSSPSMALVRGRSSRTDTE